MNRGPWNSIKGPRYVNRGPCNVIIGLSNLKRGSGM